MSESEKERRLLGDDTLSKVWRELTPLDEADAAPMLAEIENIVLHLRAGLVERKWPDPLAMLTLRNGRVEDEEPEGVPSIERVAVALANGAELVPGWRAIRRHLENERQALTDDWYAAKLIGIALDALHGDDDLRHRALVNFGFHWRDWRTRRSFGRIAKETIEARRNLGADEAGGRARYNQERRASAEKWHRPARQLAAALWERRPELSAQSVARSIMSTLEAELKKEKAGPAEMAVSGLIGDLPLSEAQAKRAIGIVRAELELAGSDMVKTPSVKRIRDVISPLKPKPK